MNFRAFVSTLDSSMVSSLVTRRKVSGGTYSDLGRDCRFLGLAKTHHAQNLVSGLIRARRAQPFDRRR
jgi:hypothetical protein